MEIQQILEKDAKQIIIFFPHYMWAENNKRQQSLVLLDPRIIIFLAICFVSVRLFTLFVGTPFYSSRFPFEEKCPTIAVNVFSSDHIPHTDRSTF